jgi:hypothetical protein
MINNQYERPIQTIRRLLDHRLVTLERVVVIGLGGIGMQLARPLAVFLASLADYAGDEPGRATELVLCDGDSFAPENSYRMDIVDYGNKAEVVGRELIERLPTSSLAIRWVSQFVTPHNVGEIIQEGDCVFLACDKHATRKIVGQHCAGGSISSVVLISGGNDGIEDGRAGTYGNIQVFVRKDGNDLTAPIERFHPEIADPIDKAPDQLSCLELVAAGAPQLLFANLAVASGMCNALLRLLMPRDQQAIYDEVAFDIAEAISSPLWLSQPERR